MERVIFIPRYLKLFLEKWNRGFPWSIVNAELLTGKQEIQFIPRESTKFFQYI